MFGRKKADERKESVVAANPNDAPLDTVEKSFMSKLWPVIACGAGLFSDGYLNGVIGSVNTILGKIYPTEYKKFNGASKVTSFVFLGTVVGQLVFGYTSDKWSRKNSMIVSTIILIIFAALAAGSYGAGGSIQGMLAALTAYRFLLGIGIGGEYPAGSVACAESTGELKEGTRNRWFIMFTNVAIDVGFVVAAFVPLVLLWICGLGHLRLVWRLALGLGVVPPLSMLYLRFKLKEPEEYKRETMRNVRTPYWLALKYYGLRLITVSVIWFIYDFSAYSFGIYSSSIVDNILGDDTSLYKSFGWGVVINLFYIPGAVLGGPFSDWVGPKTALTVGVTAQAIVGYIMAGCYAKLSEPKNVAGFAVVYGIFLSFGELGPGDNIGLIASKTSATSVRGQYYAIAAAVGKFGAFAGTYALDTIQKNAGPSLVKQGQDPFWVASSLALFAGILAFVALPTINQDTITKEDLAWREYLTANGWDVQQMGTKEYASSEEIGHTDSGEAARISEKE